MKISREERQRTYRRIVEAAVAVISEHGFRDATMHEIAERAGVGDATIYKYFATKERLLFAFFELRMEDLIDRLKGIEGFHEHSFREQLHIVLETQLELFAADRAFLRVAYRNVFFTDWIATATGAKSVRDRFAAIVDDLLTSAVEVGEFEEPPFKSALYSLLWEYAVGVTYYWLEDESPQYANTTQVIDKSLAVLDAVLQSRLLSTMADLTQFLVREHLLARLRPLGGASEFVASGQKKPFMSRGEAEQQGDRKSVRKGARKGTRKTAATQRKVGTPERGRMG